MKTERIDFKEPEVFDLMDQKILLPESFQRNLGNLIYISGSGIEMADLGRKIFYAERDQQDLALSVSELKMLNDIFDTYRLVGQPLHEAIKQYLINKIENLNNQ